MMKKSTFVAMILGTIGGILFALGMCMALIPEWNAFQPGIIMGVIGVVVLLVMVLVWRRMENKAPVKLSGKAIGATLMGIVGGSGERCDGFSSFVFNCISGTSKVSGKDERQNQRTDKKKQRVGK